VGHHRYDNQPPKGTETKISDGILLPKLSFFLNWDFPNPTLERGSVGAGVRAPAAGSHTEHLANYLNCLIMRSQGDLISDNITMRIEKKDLP
jgi:hypothetical protein